MGTACCVHLGKTGRLIAGIASALWQIAFVPTAFAIELWSSNVDDRYLSLDASMKWTSLLSYAPDDTAFYPERWSSASLWRMRLAIGAQPASWLTVKTAYEQRARAVSEGSGAAGGFGILVSENRAPYRISQIDESLVEIGSTFAYRHELDRVFVAAHLGRTEIIIGRQAIGWGRGVLFSAVDIFAPFSPLESDREWRRGIDAVRVGTPVTDLMSVEVVAAFGESRETSALVGRMRGYLGNVDGEMIFGKRREDYVYAATASLPVLDAELHGEVALFKTPGESPDCGVFGRDDLIAKTVIGGSYSFELGIELYLMAEYHHSGFGVRDIKDLETCLEEEALRERFVRGDTQILGRHAGVVQAVYGIGGVSPLNISWIFSPMDGSGIFVPTVSWIFSDNVTLVANAYLPYGAEPKDGKIRSEYGGTPTSGLLQISFYY